MRFFILLPFIVFSTFLFSQTSIKDCHNHLSGKVLNIDSDETISSVHVTIATDNEFITSTVTDNNGYFKVDLPCDNKRYIVSATVENFTKSTKLVFTTAGVSKKHTITLDVYPIREFTSKNGKKKIIVDQIYFIPDDIGITKEAAKELRIVRDLLNKYPDMVLEIGFHSDSRGDERFLTSLTQKRADACASYLINNGIESDRIITRGFGSSKLLNECERGVKCSNDKHLINKRSEFFVFKKDLSTQMATFE